jgi:hypothetical protein
MTFSTHMIHLVLTFRIYVHNYMFGLTIPRISVREAGLEHF